MKICSVALLLLLAAPGVGLCQVSDARPYGTVYDITGVPIADAVVTLETLVDTTDAQGNYDFRSTSSVEDPEPPPPRYVRKRVPGGGCEGPKYVMVPEEEDDAGRPLIENPLPNMLYFEKANHWTAAHDLTGQAGEVRVNATLPSNIGTRYGIAVTPLQFRDIWQVIDQHPTYMRTISYRTENLPIPVDGDMNSQTDWDLLQASVNRLNEVMLPLIGGPMYVVSPGNGQPSRDPPHYGIYIYHLGQSSTFADPMSNDPENPQWLIGGRIYILESDFVLPGGNSLDKELLYRMANLNSWRYPNGIFYGSPDILTDFNREHLHLLRQLVMAKEAGKNDLTAFDYVRLTW